MTESRSWRSVLRVGSVAAFAAAGAVLAATAETVQGAVAVVALLGVGLWTASAAQR